MIVETVKKQVYVSITAAKENLTITTYIINLENQLRDFGIHNVWHIRIQTIHFIAY